MLAWFALPLVILGQSLVTGPPEEVVAGLEFSEGPVWTAEGLLFSDVVANKIYRADKSVFRENTGGANGLALDDEGQLIACQGSARQVARIDSDGTITVIADAYDGKRFNAPNDLVIRSDGTIFFTDPMGLRADDVSELGFSGVYAITPDGDVVLLGDDFKYPNGIALSPDETTLYVSETTGADIRAFDLDGTTLSNDRVFTKVSIPDGITVDADGNVWSTSSGGIVVFSPDGEELERIKTPMPTNCAFGGDDGSSLFVTVRSAVLRIPTKVRGVAWAKARDASYTVVADGFQFTEGPVWLPLNRLAFSDIPADTVYLADGSVLHRPSGQSNGLAVDPQGRLIRCEHGTRQVTRAEHDGTLSVLADTYDGKRFNSPNDAVVRADGTIFFTDPPYGLGDREPEMGFNGVFAIRPDGEVVLLAADFNRPNGIGLSPDATTLYVADTAEGHVRVFDVSDGPTLENGRVLCELPTPDGMALDGDGNLWVTSLRGVVVFAPDGQEVRTLTFPQIPANCAFGGENFRTLYATARTAVYAVDAGVAGLRLFQPKSVQ